MSERAHGQRSDSRRGVNRVLVAFAAIYAVLIASSWGAVAILGPRLPAQARDLATFYLEAEVIGIAMYLGWIALPHEHRVRYALETVLPIGLVLLGTDAAGLAAAVSMNLDSSAFAMPLVSPLGLAIMICGAFAGAALGRYLSGIAASDRLRREATAGPRSAWFCETSADRSWRRSVAITYGILLLPFVALVQATAPAYGAAGTLLVQLLIVGAWAFTVVVGEHATVSISDAAVRVRTRMIGNYTGWSLALSEIESANAVEARPEPLRFDRNRCILRSGPALEVRTRGGRYAVSLDAAGEAAALIAALRSGDPRQRSRSG
jgi:hypothetical protein